MAEQDLADRLAKVEKYSDGLQDRVTNLAIAVVNLRKALQTANVQLTRYANERGGTPLLVMCDEASMPTFREGRSFWAEVRKLTGESGGSVDERVVLTRWQVQLLLRALRWSLTRQGGVSLSGFLESHAVVDPNPEELASLVNLLEGSA